MDAPVRVIVIQVQQLLVKVRSSLSIHDGLQVVFSIIQFRSIGRHDAMTF